MLVVIDTSTFISGVLWTGLPHRLIELAEAGQITLCATEETLVELREVLSRPKFAAKLRDRLTSVDEIMQSVLALVALYPVLPAFGMVQADPGDDKIVACALAAGSEYLISRRAGCTGGGNTTPESFTGRPWQKCTARNAWLLGATTG